MASKTTVVAITHAKPGSDLLCSRTSLPSSTEGRHACNELALVLESIAGGEVPASLEVVLGDTIDARASATITCALVQAGDTVTINGVVFTAIANASTPSGDQFRIGTGGGSTQNNACATNLAAIINATTTTKVPGYVYATRSGAVVTVSARAPGLLGNMCTLVSSDAGRLAVTGSGNLAGGTGRGTAPTTYSLL